MEETETKSFFQWRYKYTQTQGNTNQFDNMFGGKEHFQTLFTDNYFAFKCIKGSEILKNNILETTWFDNSKQVNFRF